MYFQQNTFVAAIYFLKFFFENILVGTDTKIKQAYDPIRTLSSEVNIAEKQSFNLFYYYRYIVIHSFTLLMYVILKYFEYSYNLFACSSMTFTSRIHSWAELQSSRVCLFKDGIVHASYPLASELAPHCFYLLSKPISIIKFSSCPI